MKTFIDEHPEINLKLFEVQKRKGKTNAQDEAQKIVDTDFLVMTDANSLLAEDSVTHSVFSVIF